MTWAKGEWKAGQAKASEGAKTKRKGPSAATIQAARERALATLAGTYQAPKPEKHTRTSKFIGGGLKRPRDLAVRSATGSRIGPR